MLFIVLVFVFVTQFFSFCPIFFVCQKNIFKKSLFFLPEGPLTPKHTLKHRRLEKNRDIDRKRPKALCSTALRQFPPILCTPPLLDVCTFSDRNISKKFFLCNCQPRIYRVNSPRSGTLSCSLICAVLRLAPRRYINFVTAASIVMSYPLDTPICCRRRPVS